MSHSEPETQKQLGLANKLLPHPGGHSLTRFVRVLFDMQPLSVFEFSRRLMLCKAVGHSEALMHKTNE